jgi:hypothetical protein
LRQGRELYSSTERREKGEITGSSPYFIYNLGLKTAINLRPISAYLIQTVVLRTLWIASIVSIKNLVFLFVFVFVFGHRQHHPMALMELERRPLSVSCTLLVILIYYIPRPKRCNNSKRLTLTLGGGGCCCCMKLLPLEKEACGS